MPIGGAEPPGAVTEGTAVLQEKPRAFVDFEDYINSDAKRLDDLVVGIGAKGANKGSDQTFWDRSPIRKKDLEHFLGDWLGGGYWPNDAGEQLFKALRKGVHQGAVMAQSGSMKLCMDLYVDPHVTRVEAKATQDGTSVTIKVVTPPPLSS